MYQGSYNNAILDKIEPPFKSAEHYFSHLANLPPKERLGFSPYIYTADNRPPNVASSTKAVRPPSKPPAKPSANSQRRGPHKIKTVNPRDPPVLARAPYTQVWPHDAP